MTTSTLDLSEPLSRSSGPLRVRSLRSLEEVDALEDRWRQLDRQAASPLVQFSWIRSCLASFAATDRPHVVAVSRDNRLVALAPLVKRRLRGVSRLFLAGVSDVFEPADLIGADQRAVVRVARLLARGGTPLVLERMPADSLGVRQLKRAFRGRAIVLTRTQATCPYIALDESWLEPEQHLNAGRRGDLRRARRKAEQAGPVTTEIHTPDLSELAALVDTAFEVEASSWKGEAGTALARDAHRAVFYRQYAEAACVEGILRVCFLRIGDRVAAMQLAIEQGDGFWLLKVGYDARFGSCSPGLLLMRETIRYAVEAGLSSYEFLGRAEAWTRVWTQTEHRYVALRIYPFGVRGMSALAADSAAHALARWRKK